MKLSAGERSPVKAADWLEEQVVCSWNGQAHTRDIVGAMLAEGDMVVAEDWDDHDLSEDDEDRSGAGIRLADNTEVEIDRRRDLCGADYPFDFERGLLQWKEPGKWADPYLVCLLAADRDISQPGDDTGKVFEHLATLAVASFLGGNAVRFGAPRDTMAGPINDALKDLAQRTSSRLIRGWPVTASDKDLGLDVVGWKKFPDPHNNRLQLYVQCATGEGWDRKKGDLNLKTWEGILQWGLPPVPALAIPYVAEGDGLWIRNLAGTLMLDRIRIVSALSGRILPDGPVSWAQWVRDRVDAAAADS